MTPPVGDSRSGFIRYQRNSNPVSTTYPPQRLEDRREMYSPKSRSQSKRVSRWVLLFALLLNVLHIQDKNASAVRATNQFMVPRMDKQVVHRSGGQMIAERMPFLAVIQGDIRAQIRTDVEQPRNRWILTNNVDRFRWKIACD